MREQELKEQPLCVYCLEEGRVTAATEIDHVKPLSLGGAAHDPDNRAPSCRACNLKKGNRPPRSPKPEGQEIEPPESTE